MSTPHISSLGSNLSSLQNIAASSGETYSNTHTIGISSNPIRPNILLKRTAFVCGVICIASLTIAAMVGTMGVGLLPVACLLGALSAGTFLGGCVSWAGYVASTREDPDESDTGPSHMEQYGKDAAAYQAAMAAMDNSDNNHP